MFRSVGNELLDYTASHPRKQESSESQAWEHQNPYISFVDYFFIYRWYRNVSNKDFEITDIFPFELM
jgi:hypothetical protein